MDETGAKILIVEDDATIARFVELELTHLGHEVYKVADGDLAVAEIERVCPDLVLLDLMLPGKDGLTIARELREHGEQMPILMLTARSETQDVVKGFDAGADDYLRKPFEVPELLSRVGALLKRVDHDRPVTSYKAANVELDPASRGVLVDGKPVNFTAKEYDLLEYFVANAGRVISRDEILEKVWGGQHATDSNVIEVFVCHLRNKINDNDNQVIRTIRGVGLLLREKLMRRSSLRTTLLVVSILFAMLVVGGIALTTYVIVSDGMQVVAIDTTARLASTAEAVVRQVVSAAESEAASRGLSGEVAASAALRTVALRLPEAMSRAGMSEASFALFDENLDLVWASKVATVSPAQNPERQAALASGMPQRSIGRKGDMVSGLISAARLGATVNHTPVKLPGGANGVLDVTHTPASEERVIDAIRRPMAVLAVAAMIIMVLLMQTSMVWVLGLIDNLRKAADSIDAGRLDERLPVAGNSEISELAVSLNNLIERLQRRSEAQARFVADASHELATPVAGIRGYTSILRAWGADDPKVRDEAVDAIDRESRRMARLTADLLNLLHADQGLVLRSEKFDLNALVRERIAASASRWLDKDIEYEGPEEDSLLMTGDPDRVEDIISILLDNASKYTPPLGRVSVQTRRKRENVLIEVTDSGQGIPAEDLPRIFDRFFRSEASRAAGEGGFGLGLAILRSIVESMGGEIHVSSTVGEGTMFTIRLPKGRL